MMSDPIVVTAVPEGGQQPTLDNRAEARRLFQSINEQFLIIGGDAALSVSKLTEQLYEIVLRQTIQVVELKQQVLRSEANQTEVGASLAETTSLQGSTNSSRSSSHSRSRSRTRRDNILLVYPEDKVNSETLKKRILKAINPSELQIGVIKVTKVKNKGLLFKLSKPEDIDKLSEAIRTKENLKANPVVPKKRSPRIIVQNSPSKTSFETVRDEIIKQFDVAEEDLTKKFPITTEVPEWTSR